MSENLIDSVEKDMAVLADPNASMEEKRYAKTDLMLSRRLIAKGVTELSDGAGPDPLPTSLSRQGTPPSGVMYIKEVDTKWHILQQ